MKPDPNIIPHAHNVSDVASSARAAAINHYLHEIAGLIERDFSDGRTDRGGILWIDTHHQIDGYRFQELEEDIIDILDSRGWRLEDVVGDYTRQGVHIIPKSKSW